MTLTVPGDGEVEPCDGVGGGEFDLLLEGFGFETMLAALAVEDAEVVPGARVIGSILDRLLIVKKREPLSALCLVKEREVVVRFRVVGLDLQSPLETGHRFAELSLIF